MIGIDCSSWEDQVVADLVAAAIPELNQDGAVFQIEVLDSQIDFKNDQMNRATPHILISWGGADHTSGYPGADPMEIHLVAVVPGGLQRERRMLANNACVAIANWMRGEAGTIYQPTRTEVLGIHPMAVSRLTATIVQ